MKAYGELKKDLFSFKSEKLTKFSIFLIILLDIFLFGLVCNGIDNEQKANIRTSDVFTYKCMRRFESSIEITYSNLNSNSYKHYDSKTGYEDPRCLKIDEKYQALINHPEIVKNKARYDQIKKSQYKTKRELKKTQKRYDTELLEVIANQKNKPTIVQNNYSALLGEERTLEQRIKRLKKPAQYQVYKDYINYKDRHSTAIKADRASYQKWYKFKDYLYLLKFVLPLLLITLFFYFRNKTKQLKAKDFNNIVLIISCHLLVVLSIPLFIGFLDVIYSIIPKIFFGKIIAFLVAIGAEFLGFYGIMLLAILIVFGLVYYLQKYEKKKHKNFSVIYKNINKGLCFDCKNKVDYSKDHYCGVCATKLQEKCEHCSEYKIKNAPHCRNCGK